MYSRYAFRHRCAACGSPLLRVPRTELERATRGVTPTGRYRCTREGCGWESMLPRRERALSQDLLAAVIPAMRSRLLPMLAAAGFGAALAVWALPGPKQASTAPLAHGVSHDGDPLPILHPLRIRAARLAPQADTATAAGASDTQEAALQLRGECAWGQPGRNPYRGSVEQALGAAGLPGSVIKNIALQVRTGRATDRLDVSNDGIRAKRSGRVFSADNLAMTYGMTLCTRTKVNFVRGHTEGAALYEAADARGRVFSVMVPEVCGNVSILGQVDDAGAAEAAADASEISDNEDPDSRRMTADLNWQESPSDPGRQLDRQRQNTVPEPGSLVLVSSALVLMVWGLSRRRKNSMNSTASSPTQAAAAGRTPGRDS